MTRVYVVSGSDEPKKVIQTELLRTIKHVNCAMLIQDELISPRNMIGGCDTYSSHREMSGTHCNTPPQIVQQIAKQAVHMTTQLTCLCRKRERRTKESDSNGIA